MEPTLSSPATNYDALLARYQARTQSKPRYGLHIGLFLITVFTTIYAGGDWAQIAPRFTAAWWGQGALYAGALLFFLTTHEFGHYFAARRHNLLTSLPFYIPFPPIPFFLNIGTFGAVIRIREALPSTRKLFDVGVAGPLAGFVVALGVVIYGLATLPSPEYVNNFFGHGPLKSFVENHGQYPTVPLEEGVLMMGQTPLFWLLSQVFPNVPPMFEVYHFPILFAGWLGLFFTALNLLPVGQLDGGHILYALVGPKWHGRLARGFFLFLLLIASIGFTQDMLPFLNFQFDVWIGVGHLGWFALAILLYFFLNRLFNRDQRLMAPALLGLMALTVLAQALGPAVTEFGYTGWFFWCLLIILVIRVDHPSVLYTEPLSKKRKALGILSMVIFVLCFSLKPFYFA